MQLSTRSEDIVIDTLALRSHIGELSALLLLLLLGGMLGHFSLHSQPVGVSLPSCPG